MCEEGERGGKGERGKEKGKRRKEKGNKEKAVPMTRAGLRPAPVKGPSVMTATNAVIPMTRGARFFEMLRGSTTVAKYTHTRANVQINSNMKTATPWV
jgi:hypothetical protein